jgi:dTDP-L-rhamnose 4-epimerase
MRTLVTGGVGFIALLGFEAEVSLEDGMADLVQWLAGQEAVDRVDDATRELSRRGLTR